MNNNSLHFQDPTPMLNPQPPSFSPANSLLQPTTPLEANLSSEQKSSEKYQKSNNSPSEQEEQCDNDERLKAWTLQQQNTLICLHNLKGNKWVQISQALSKSDNQVKNHYHSRLRKGIRKINKFICEEEKGTGKCIKSNIISKIIQTAEDVFEADHAPQAKEAYQLKNVILAIANIAEDDLEESQKKTIHEAVARITSFNKNYRKKCKITPVKPPNSTKYKGKEIKTLLRENELNTYHQAKRERVRYYPEKEIVPPQSIQIPSLPTPIVPQPINSFQTYMLFNQACFAYPSYPSYSSYSSFYLACLPTSHLETYDRFSNVLPTEVNSMGQIVQLQTSMEEEPPKEDSEVSFR